jgi:enamine deaminase RidA (YjgF/YER057c/UK114 family)
MNIERIDPGPRMSQAVVCGDLVFTAGQVAEKSAGAR